MAYNPPTYYSPYISESDEESQTKSELESHGESYDSDSDSDSSTATGNSIAKGLDDPRYAIIKAAGPNFPTVTDQLFYEHSAGLHSALVGSAYEAQPVKDASNNVIVYKSPLYENPKKTVRSSLFSFKSIDRDIQVYPFSSFFSLKTPRTYKHVTQIQIVQINFQYFANAIPDMSGIDNQILNFLSTLGFSKESCIPCLQTQSSFNGLGISEVGRINPVAPSTVLVHGIKIRPGNYDSVGLVNELDKQMNKTPPFRIISYAEHKKQFHATRTLKHLFNEGGKWFYDAQGGSFSRNVSNTDIMTAYFPHITPLNAASITDTETFVAYFYPVLKEALKDKFASQFIDLDGDSLKTVQNRVLHHYEGLQSNYYYNLCSTNLTYLRKLRDSHTFKYHPIHSYQWNYNPYTNRVGMIHTDLHPSLNADIQNTHAASRTHHQSLANLTPTQFTRLEQSLTRTLTTVAGLTSQLSNALTTIGIPYGLYNADYYYVSTNTISTATTTLTTTSDALDTQLLNMATGIVVPPTPPFSTTPRVPPYSFSWSTLSEILNESSTASLATPSNYDPPYLSKMTVLNNASIISSVSGVPCSCVDFPSLYSTFQSYVSTSQAAASTVSTVHTNALSTTKGYVQTTYSDVFPPAMLQNDAYMNNKGPGGVTTYANVAVIKPSTPFDDITNSGAIYTTDTIQSLGVLGTPTTVVDTSGACCAFIQAAFRNIYSCIPAEYIQSVGLLKKAGFSGNILAYYSTIAAEGSLLRSNVYLQLNTEQSMNNMDVAKMENYNISNETTGEHKLVLGKLLTEGTGLQDITQTIVQLPAKFETPLGAVDHLSMTLLLDTLIPIYRLFPFPLQGDEWNGILQIDEEVGTLDRETDLSPVPTVDWANKPY